MLYRFYSLETSEKEKCFNVECVRELTDKEIKNLIFILADGFNPFSISRKSKFEKSEEKVAEVGPRLNFETPFSTHLVSICRSCGIEKVERVELSRRYLLRNGEDPGEFLAKVCDRMTECEYSPRPTTFKMDSEPEPIKFIPLIEKGIKAFDMIEGLNLEDWEMEYYYNYFVLQEKRNPTETEIMDLNNANSEHSRHFRFNGRHVIDGVTMPETLMEIVKSTLKNNSSQNSVIAFSDNASAIRGFKCIDLTPFDPSKSSPYTVRPVTYHPVFTAETHNFPTGVAPFPGAETGTGGRLRDNMAAGRGALTGVATAGYCVGNLGVDDPPLPWEDRPPNLADPLKIEIEASNGASDYGNKFGEPVIAGFTRSFDQVMTDGQRWGWLKPIMFTGGLGKIDDRHTRKEEGEEGMLIVQIGGPAYRIGIGGGAASSMMHGENESHLDFDAVQRGDAEMERKTYNVIRACVEMGSNNPIVSIHDQGAGGPGNVLKELVEEVGGMVDIRRINIGDPTMSATEIWVAEYQERLALLIRPRDMEVFRGLCNRENTGCEILGNVTGDCRFVAYDSREQKEAVNLDLAKVLGGMPRQTYYDKTFKTDGGMVEIPESLSFKKALLNVLKDLDVGSKRFLVNKVDRSVSGLVAGQQCCGPVQLPVADCAVAALSHFTCKGMVTSIGEQPYKMIVNPYQGAKMAVAEAVTNMAGVKITSVADIKCSVNWMWAPKLPGENAALYQAVSGVRDAMRDLDIAVDGGKDSLSMAAKAGEQVVKSPRQGVVSAYVAVPDITVKATPDIKYPGESSLFLIDLSAGKKRLGGSILSKVFGFRGNDCPDFDLKSRIKRCVEFVQKLVEKEMAVSVHDRSDGGLAVTVCEMAFSGNCGIHLQMEEEKEFDSCFGDEKQVIVHLFCEELGLAVECPDDRLVDFKNAVHEHGMEKNVSYIGATCAKKEVRIDYNGKNMLAESMELLRDRWESTSFQLEKQQTNKECVKEERKNIYRLTDPCYSVSFSSESLDLKPSNREIHVAILREEGSNSEREMAAAFEEAGFTAWDVHLDDLLKERIDLDRFQGLIAVGGFSYADHPASAKGMASKIMFNKKLKRQFDQFRDRPHTFSLGVCNGCQLLAMLGWVPGFNLEPERQPLFKANLSGRFESRWSAVRIMPTPSVMLQGMEDSVLGIWTAHGEGRLDFPDNEVKKEVFRKQLAPIVYTDHRGYPTEQYPFNPNGSPAGITSLCSEDGRHLAIMPHPERTFRKWHWAWMPEWMDKQYNVSPWLRMFQNARRWCENN
jgi:phosphoribosylformylglycinamidine synthase